MDSENIKKTGTTTVGIVCKDGVVLAADKRATSGNLIVQKDTEKVQNLTPSIAITMAGTVSDAQLLVRLARSELKIRQMRNDVESSVKEAANLLARMVYSNIRKPSMIPGVSHFLMAGNDETGNYLYDIFADGSISFIEQFVSSGSGSVMAYGLLENQWKKDMSIDEGVDLAFGCINSAVARDSASGNGIDVFTITKDGAKRVAQKQIDYQIQK